MALYSHVQILHKTEFDVKFNGVIENYKQDLKTESITVYPKTMAKSDSSKISAVHITILEPQNLPKNDAEIDEKVYGFAQKTYNALEKKKDFSAIKVEIAFNEEYFCDAYRRINFTYTFEEIESDIAKLN